MPLDPNFHGIASIKADSKGEWRIVTIKPGGYDSPIGHRLRGGFERCGQVHGVGLGRYRGGGAGFGCFGLGGSTQVSGIGCRGRCLRVDRLHGEVGGWGRRLLEQRGAG